MVEFLLCLIIFGSGVCAGFIGAMMALLRHATAEFDGGFEHDNAPRVSTRIWGDAVRKD